jgi:hypothetical protein
MAGLLNKSRRKGRKMKEYMIDDQYSNVGIILSTKKGNNFIAKFFKITWLLLNSKYWKEVGQKTENGQYASKFNIIKDGNRVGIGIIRQAKYGNKEPYLHLIKHRKNTMNGIAGKSREYFVFDLDDDFNPKINSPIRAKIFSKTYY